ncbi:AAA family ATPase [Pseudanabaena mucicola]|uniref:AAA family ATPase n=1 Tax=Pseudanabaena mucicola FACHB-723 TaxID=2692860 RepID=A0ABR7ZWK9_9CYAN|nr:AAA family ATPase [Pseudanabaena mucicola]MBD2188348.1 AAA family ATPase [Pseudanabaena mucicola FACHB-723]
MHLQRVQVPDFRVLKDVDITFEKDFNPRVFPLGSQNGGGKSTLLQLIFVLLHCSASPKKHFALKNLLSGFDLRKDEHKRLLAIVDIWDGKKSVQLDFFVCRNSYINQNLTDDKKEDTKLDFSLITELEKTRTTINVLSKDLNRVSDVLKTLYSVSRDNKDIATISLRQLSSELRNLGIEVSRSLPVDPQLLSVVYTSIETALKEKQQDIQIRINDLKSVVDTLNLLVQELMIGLQSKNIEYICSYGDKINKNDPRILLCQANKIDIKEAKDFLKSISNKVFLAAPSTQVFLFLSQDVRKLLFAEHGHSFVKHTSYLQKLKESNAHLSGLFTYDFLAVDLLIESFKDARDKDFRQALGTGEYGNSYKALLNDLDALLNNKRVNLKPDFSALTFTTNLPDDDVELYPEDLSHGELKRLSIYMWLKHRNIEDAIVLMDEVDLALHPDWQYQIVSDLLDWVSSNQYILATHSYELCNALTPSHVKILEPKLTERRSD